MIYTEIVTENQLDGWVRGNAQSAQGVIVELVLRLVAAASPNPKDRRFPLGDSIGQPGPDGFLDTDFPFDPFVPAGKSYWEIGTGDKPASKATKDYKNLTQNIPAETRFESTFLFVTPLSGRRAWPYTWKKDSQATWLKNRIERKEWRGVRVIDATKLIDWLHRFPAVELWLANVMGFPSTQMQTPEQRWSELKGIGDPPPLIPRVFLANRDAACTKLEDLFSGNTLQLQLDTRFPEQVADFVSAYLAATNSTTRVDLASRCIIVTSADAWNRITALGDPHVLIADFYLGETDASGTRLLERAKRARHAVIFGGLPGGIPHPNRIPIPSPSIGQIEDALGKAGYNGERARILAQKSDGNLNSLLKCIQNLSLMPEWSQRTDAAELAIASLLGAWNERLTGDRTIAEALSKKAYGEWNATMREIALRPGTPLIQREGVWKVTARYEAWYALGRRLFDDHLDRMSQIAVSVLKERDPAFELPPDERYAASIHGKILAHSRSIRNGLAETLALLGSHPAALTSCSTGKADATARLTVRRVLDGADWVLWASLSEVLPFLAEAAPGEFLDSVEGALDTNPTPFDVVFAQEGSGIAGSNYITGLLWALETLAWDPQYLNRSVRVLGELAARDPGGRWANRPAHSLSAILLPWLPQTCAPRSNRLVAVNNILREYPEVGWRLLLTLLPSSYQTSSFTRKPVWRQIIPDNWPNGVTRQENWDQAVGYSELAVRMARNDLPRTATLIERLDDLPSQAREHFLTYLRSEAVVSMPPKERLLLWTKLTDLIAKHKVHSDADWAMKPGLLNHIAAVAGSISPDTPMYIHQRLFGEQEFYLYEKKASYQEQAQELQNRRETAIGEVFATGGVNSVLEFAKAVESPWRVGVALGSVVGVDAETRVLPTLLESEVRSLAQLAGGFVQGMFSARGWPWVDSIDTSGWSPSQKGQFFAYLPFAPDTWTRVDQLLKNAQPQYWTKASVNPFQVGDKLDLAVDKLVEYGRPNAAIGCLYKMLNDKRPLDKARAVKALLSSLSSNEPLYPLQEYEIPEIIKALQEDNATYDEDLFTIEWAYLPLLAQDPGPRPKLLEGRLASDPGFFCEVIRLVYRSKKASESEKKSTEQDKGMATNAYRLLRAWRTPPGTQPDGVFSKEHLAKWLESMRVACSESGHLEVALTHVGNVLIHCPPDPDGLWIHRAAAEALNAKAAQEMRNGFGTALINSRGVHSVDPTGKPELELSAAYTKQADDVENAGYQRLATEIRSVAGWYAYEAKRITNEARQE